MLSVSTVLASSRVRLTLPTTASVAAAFPSSVVLGVVPAVVLIVVTAAVPFRGVLSVVSAVVAAAVPPSVVLSVVPALFICHRPRAEITRRN